MKIGFALALALCAAPALAQPAADSAPVAAVSKGAMVFAADGRRIGRVDRVRDAEVGIIYNGKMVLIPLATLTASDRGYTTSLTKADLARL